MREIIWILAGRTYPEFSDVVAHINTVNSHYLEFQGTLWNTSRYPYFDMSYLQNWGKTNSINHI